MGYKTFNKEEALKIWDHEFGNVLYAHDFTGRKVKKDDYLVENQVGWVVAYMKPLSLGGEQNEDNDMIVHHITAYEKADKKQESSKLSKSAVGHYQRKK